MTEHYKTETFYDPDEERYVERAAFKTREELDEEIGSLTARVAKLEGHIRNVAHRHAQVGATSSDPRSCMTTLAMAIDRLDEAIAGASRALAVDTAEGGRDGE